jgi:hypothetical protein
MQTVLNKKPSCLLKGGLAFLLGKSQITFTYLKLFNYLDIGKIGQV